MTASRLFRYSDSTVAPTVRQGAGRVLLGPVPLLVLATIFWALLIRWTGPLSEIHDFRQSQTALSAYWMLRDGINFLHPPMPVFGAAHPSVPMEFPLYQVLVALLAHTFYAAPLPATLLAGRVVNFASFLLAAYAFYRLVDFVHDRVLANLAMALFLFMPYAAAWAAAESMEYLALAFALFYLEAATRIAIGAKPTNPWLFAWVAFAGALAMLLKITTALVYGPVLLLLWVYWGFVRKPRPTILNIFVVTLCAAIIPFVVGDAWVQWSDMVKAQSPLTIFLTSAGSWAWNFGSMAERFSLWHWIKIGGYWAVQIMAVFGIAFAAGGVRYLWRRDRLVLLYWALPPLTGALVFFNLYFHHDYYQIAILPSLTLVMAAGFRALFWRRPEASLLRTGMIMTVFLSLCWGGLAAQTLVRGYRTPPAMLSEFRLGPSKPSAVRRRDLMIVHMLRTRTRPTDVSLIAVDTWSSVIPLLAERRVVMDVNCKLVASLHLNVNFYVVDSERSLCRKMHIPKRCLITRRDGISLGTCVSGKP